MMRFITWLATFFSAIGAINWGLKAFFNFDIVKWAYEVSEFKLLDKILYAVIALSGLISLLMLFRFE